jgi:cell division protein FtsI (penicillin-binding protein 3)
MTKVRAAFLSLFLSTTACSAAPRAAPSMATSAATPDLAIPRIANEELDHVVSAWSATRAVIVVFDPTSGEVLAMDGREQGRAAPTLAATRAWITGSTLKPITIAAAIEHHTIALDQRFACGERAYGSEALHDAKEGPCAPLDAAGIVAQSSNVGTSYVFDSMGSGPLTAWLGRLHIGDAPGWVPRIDDDKSLLAANFAGGEVVKATPLQMVLAYAGLFNDGVYVVPSAPGRAPARTRVISEETARTVVSMLENAVAGEGTGKAARVDGLRVAGKTGTASWTDEQGKEMYYVSFVGSVLDREPRFVALVGLEAPAGKASGPTAAAPAWGRLAARIVQARSNPPPAISPASTTPAR